LKILLYTDLTIRPDQLFWHRYLGQESLHVVCAKLGLVFRIMLIAPLLEYALGHATATEYKPFFSLQLPQSPNRKDKQNHRVDFQLLTGAIDSQVHKISCFDQ